MVRAHVAALGGNAVVSYSMKECVFMENPNKNQVHTYIYLKYLLSYSPSLHESTMKLLLSSDLTFLSVLKV